MFSNLKAQLCEFNTEQGKGGPKRKKKGEYKIRKKERM
jgi:hypothetical protein